MKFNSQTILSKNNVLTIVVILFFVSLFMVILIRWNKSTEGFTTKPPAKFSNQNAKLARFASKKELFDNPDIKNAAQEVFAALEKFSQAKNNALTPQSQSQSAPISKHK